MAIRGDEEAVESSSSSSRSSSSSSSSSSLARRQYEYCLTWAAGIAGVERGVSMAMRGSSDAFGVSEGALQVSFLLLVSGSFGGKIHTSYFW